MARQPSGPGIRRGRTVQGQWTSAVLENVYECTSRDPEELEVWCYTDRLSYAPGGRVCFHVNTTAPHYDLEIVRDGVTPETVYRAEGLAGAMHPTPEDCSVNGCDWPVAHEFTLPDDWRSGGYIVLTSARCGDERFDHRHLFILRPGEPGRKAPMVLVCATGTWIAYNEWGGSNHYEGITGPKKDEFSTRLSIHRPWSRGFVWQPKGAPRIVLAQPPAMGAAPRYPHMEWSYANGYSIKYASTGWASYERHFVAWAEAEGYGLDVITQHDLVDRPDVLAAYGCTVFIGHDEYWSWEMRDAVDGYVEGGGKVARFAGNFMWQTRLEDEGRTQICYKYTAREKDPMRDSARSTTSWEAPEVGRPGAADLRPQRQPGDLHPLWPVLPQGAGRFHGLPARALGLRRQRSLLRRCLRLGIDGLRLRGRRPRLHLSPRPALPHGRRRRPRRHRNSRHGSRHPDRG